MDPANQRTRLLNSFVSTGGDVSLINASISTLASICIHTALLIGCALVTWGSVAPQGSVGEETEVAIGSLAAETLDDRREEILDPQTIENPHDSDENLEAMDLLVEGPNFAPSDPSIDDALGVLAPSTASGGSPASVSSVLAGGALNGQATFMGVQAQGRHFCIIADRSGSMLGDKFEFLRQEILKTLDEMRGHTRLQVVLFNTRAMAYPKPEWLHPREEREPMRVWLNGIVADGDTYPTPAFVQAFSLEPLPDAIFFMTDGLFDARVVTHIRRLNTKANRPVPVHAITFVDRSSEHMMRKIADESGGKYRHVKGAFGMRFGRR